MPRKETNPPQIGGIFGNLTVLERTSESRAYFLCQCACGNQKKIRRDHLRNGKIISCGCVRTAGSSARAHVMHAANTTHGKSRTKLHGVWFGIKQRCTNPKSTAFKYYGGKGISICERWLDFSNFFADLGEPEIGMTLDRINSNGNYEPSNCRWATRKEQMLNTSRNHYLTHNGETMTISQWAEKTGISQKNIGNRIKKGWPIPEALETPVLRRKFK